MIETNKEVILTDSAKTRLEKLHMEIDVKIENYLIERKNVPGDDFIEITASDIDELSNRLRIITPTRTNKRLLILYLYAIIGIFCTFIGLFYTEIKTLIFADKERLILIFVGISLFTTAIAMSYFYNLKDKREQALINYERELMKYNEYKSKHSS